MVIYSIPGAFVNQLTSLGGASPCSHYQRVTPRIPIGFSVAQRLCARLDAVDFKLTAALAAGTPWASLEAGRMGEPEITVTKMGFSWVS